MRVELYAEEVPQTPLCPTNSLRRVVESTFHLCGDRASLICVAHSSDVHARLMRMSSRRRRQPLQRAMRADPVASPTGAF